MRRTTLTVKEMQSLLAGQSNRRLSESWRKWYQSMLEGRWNPEISPIVLYRDGTLADGQHRLRAAIEIGKPFTCYLSQIDRNEISSVDAGRPRSTYDHAQLLSMNLCHGDIAAIRNALFCEIGRFENFMRHEQVLEAASRYDVRAYALPKGSELTGRSQLAGVLSFVAANGFSSEANEFCHQVKTGEMLRIGDPALTLRRAMLGPRLGAAAAAQAFHQKVSRAWNAFIRGERLEKYSSKVPTAFLPPYIGKDQE